MKRYQLPDILGGGVIEADEIWGGCAGGRPEYDLGNGMSIIAPAGQPFGEVAPPLPPEPPNFSTVRIGGRAYVRDDNASHLSWVGPDGRREWSELCHLAMEKTGFPPVVLIHPLSEPVQMPWRGAEQDGEAVVIDRYDETSVSLVLTGRATAWLPLDVAVEAAHALLAAVEARP